MRRAMAALAWLPDEDVEVPATSDLQAPPAGCATGIAAGGSTVGDATVTAVGGAALAAGGAAASPASTARAGGAAAAFTTLTGAAAMGGMVLVTHVATSTVGGSPASDCAGVSPDEDILSLHDAMEFHLRGRHWLELLPK